MKGPGTAIRNPWSTNGTTIASAAGGTQFTITSTNVPQKACNDAGSKMVNRFLSLTINGSSINTPSDVATACTSAKNNTFIITDS